MVNINLKLLAKRSLPVLSRLLPTFDDGEDDDLFARLFDEEGQEEVEDADDDLADEAEAVIHADDGDDPEPTQTKEPEQEEEVVEQPVVQDTPKEEPKVEAPKVEAPKEEPKPEEPQPEFDVEAYKGELQKMYAITQDDADALLAEPEKTLPRLMSNMHLMMMNHVAHYIEAKMKALPDVINTTVKASTAQEQQMAKFAEVHADLVTEEAAPYVVQAINTLRQVNPKITFDEILTKVKPVAYALMGKEVPGTQSGTVPKATVVPKPHVATRPSSAPAPKPKVTGQAAFFESLIKGD